MRRNGCRMSELQVPDASRDHWRRSAPPWTAPIVRYCQRGCSVCRTSPCQASGSIQKRYSDGSEQRCVTVARTSRQYIETGLYII